MPTAIVQKAHGIIPNLGAGGTLSFPNKTKDGNAVVVVWAFIATSAVQGTSQVTDDSGVNDPIFLFNSFFGQVGQNTNMSVEWLTWTMTGSKTTGGITSASIAPMQTITFANWGGQTNPCYVWMYELSYNGSPDAISPFCPWRTYGSADANNASANPLAPDPANVSGFLGDTGFNFLITCVAAESNNFTAVADATASGTVWNLDAAQGGLGVAYAEVQGNAQQQAKFTNLAGSFNYCSLSNIVADTVVAPSSATIIVKKQTNPSGSPQTFTFRPSWGAPFTLMDGQSMSSGALVPGTYSVSEDPVAGFTTTTNIDPTNIVLGPGQTITAIFTNSLLTPPCVPLDGSGVMANGTFIPDLALFVGPSTELYKNPIAAAVIKTFETLDEGRNAIVLDFNNSDGLYSRDLGTIFEWPVALHDVLYVWQPSIIPMPETIYGRASDWDDGGYTGDKFIQGITVEADSFGAFKTFQLQSSDDLTIHTLNEMPSKFVKQTLKSFSCNPFISHSVRIVSSDGIKWRVWGSKLVFEPLPSACMQWQTELVSLGMIGWAHAREMNIPHISTADLNLLLTFDTGITMALTIPNSGGKQVKTKVTLNANKFKLVGLRLLSNAPFRLFEGDLEMKVKPWGSGESYAVLRPFGGPSSPGATV